MIRSLRRAARLRRTVVLATVVVLALVALVSASGLAGASQGGAKTGPEGWWQFDEGSGTTARDSSGNHHDGTIVGGASYSADVSPAAGSQFSLSLDGVDDTVSVPDAPGLDFGAADALTITLWAKLDHTGSFYHLIGKRATCGDAQSTIDYQLVVDNRGLSFNSQNGGIVTTSVSNLPVGSWAHVAAVYKPAKALLKIYFNGRKVGAATPYHLSVVNNAPLEIGDSDSCHQTFPGKLDDVRIYRRALSGKEIKALAAGAHAAG